MTGELRGQQITDWVKQQEKSLFNSKLELFEQALDAIDIWLSDDGQATGHLDP